MRTHAPTDSFTKCGTFDPADEYAGPDESPSCLSCRFFDDIQALWEEYVAQPSNFGEDSHVVRMAEHDAFFAGAEKILSKVVPF